VGAHSGENLAIDLLEIVKKFGIAKKVHLVYESLIVLTYYCKKSLDGLPRTT
jgi:hypothetical protein